MVELHLARDADDVRDIVAASLAHGEALEIIGRGSKRSYGRPVSAVRHLGLQALSGISLYEPDELVLSAASATPIAEIEAALAQTGQHLAFEPFDLGPVIGGPPEDGTIGGALACNLAGPRRLSAGAARDHFLGYKGVSGFGEAYKAGSRVVKNVTGYDLCKVMAGSLGTLSVLTEVTIKVMPKPETAQSVAVMGLDDRTALRVMTAALGSPHEVSSAAHLPAEAAGLLSDAPFDRAITVLRLEGFGPSVKARVEALIAELSPLVPAGAIEVLEADPCMALWRDLRALQPILARPELILWRLSVPPADAPGVIERFGEAGRALHWYDWAGGLLWLGLEPATEGMGGDGGASRVRASLGPAGGHATLIRGPEAVRRTTPVFHPQAQALAALSQRVKASFDPSRILNPDRMYDGV